MKTLFYFPPSSSVERMPHQNLNNNRNLENAVNPQAASAAAKNNNELLNRSSSF
jgi:hypothetical protein